MTRLSCQEVLEQLWEYLDEDARGELIAQIDEHIGDCKHCRMEVDTLRRTVSLYRCDEPCAAPIQLSARLSAALQAAYAEHGRED